MSLASNARQTVMAGQGDLYFRVIPGFSLAVCLVPEIGRMRHAGNLIYISL